MTIWNFAEAKSNVHFAICSRQIAICTSPIASTPHEIPIGDVEIAIGPTSRLRADPTLRAELLAGSGVG